MRPKLIVARVLRPASKRKPPFEPVGKTAPAKKERPEVAEGAVRNQGQSASRSLASHDEGLANLSQTGSRSAITSRKADVPADSQTYLEHVERVLSNPANRDFVEEYAKELRQNWRDVCSSMGRTITLIVLSAGAFELLSRAAIAKASIGPFEIRDLSLIQTSLPVII